MSIKNAMHDLIAGDASIYALVDSRVYPEVSPGALTGMLFLNAIPTANDTVTIDGKAYTYKATVATTADEVLIGGSVNASIDNLIAAIRLTGTPGTDYGSDTVKHTTVFALRQFASTMTVIGKRRKQTAFALTETFTDGLSVWQNATARLYPYITMHLIGVEYDRHMIAADGMAKATYQIDVWGTSSVDNEAVADAILALVHGREGGTIGDPAVTIRSMSLTGGGDDYFEPTDASEVGLHRTRRDVTIWHTETVPAI